MTTREEEYQKLLRNKAILLEVLSRSGDFYMKVDWWRRNTELSYPGIPRVEWSRAYWVLRNEGLVEHQHNGWGFRVAR